MNMLLAVLTYFLAVISHSFTAPDPRIVGGITVTNRSQFAYQVSVQRFGSHTCGGSIIDARHILTAAHCCVDTNSGSTVAVPASQFTAVVGNLNIYLDDNYVERKITHVFPHEYYDPDLVFNDICVLRISGSFEPWTPYIQPISLQNNTVTEGNCNVSGWGVTQYGDKRPSSILLYVSVPVVSFSVCNARYAFDLDGLKVVCAGVPGKDSCQGDSGGPLVCNKELTGIVSFGRGCGDIYPGIYTDVARYRSWIDQQLRRSAGALHSVSLALLLVTFIVYCVRDSFIL